MLCRKTNLDNRIQQMSSGRAGPGKHCHDPPKSGKRAEGIAGAICENKNKKYDKVKSESEVLIMSNNILKTGNSGIANVTSLSAKSGGILDYDYEPYYAAAQTSVRFIRSAALLPENSFLGWQMNTEKDSHHHMFAFSGPEMQIPTEDFGWVFQESATAETAQPDSFPDMWGENRRIYALQYMPENSEEQGETNCEDNSEKKNNFSNLFDVLKEAGAALRITADTGQSRSGVILISLPEKMTLRMHAMLSLVFGDKAITEVPVPGGSLDNVRKFPAAYLEEVMTFLLRALMIDTPVSEEDESEFTEDSDTLARLEEILNSPSKPEDTVPKTIEDFDFSVRAYNCLKRAGINTVEDLCALTEYDLEQIHNITQKCVEEIKEKLAEKGFRLNENLTIAPVCPSDRLAELIGLENVKEQVRKMAALAKMKQDIEALGKDAIPIVLNMEFVGNPGTAKTTVARIIAGIFHEIGLLPSNELVEVGRADLVGKYSGHTAEKVKSVFRNAKGKLLFIDEAYSLWDWHEGSFGDEAINTIVQEMENNREDTIVIFAGYPNKMETFFARNPGLRSRVPFHISFPDYSAEEMVQIVGLEAKRRGFCLHPEAEEKVLSICASAHRPDSGNGRFCRNLVESAIINYASRVYGDGEAPADKDFVLREEDFTAPETPQKPKKATRIGFAA